MNELKDEQLESWSAILYITWYCSNKKCNEVNKIAIDIDLNDLKDIEVKCDFCNEKYIIKKEE